ncbi:MAG: NAD(P)/FAD-dependent oxidoreductase [Bacillota bacterium]|nr:NAD(P)/FAD-dependent oxidoreductase [Bacillota bacterium]
MNDYDVVIIGAGAVGCAAAKELSGYKLKTAVIEKEADLAFGTSGRNSGVVHAGFNNTPGTLKAEFCVKGSRGFEKLAEELGVPYKKTGKLVAGFSDKDREKLEELKKRGEVNGVKGLEIIDKAGIKAVNPFVEGNFALWSPETAVFDPFLYTIALAETAAANGTEFFFNSEVCEIKELEGGGYSIGIRKSNKTEKSEKKDKSEKSVKEEKADNSDMSGNEGTEIKGFITGKVVVNCGGLYSGEICRMAGIDRFDIVPCRGEYHVLDKLASSVIDLPVYPVPDEEKGVLGVHLTPTTSGNLMAGPSAEFLEEKDDYSNDENVMRILREGADTLIPELKKFPVIRSFAGIRPKLLDREGKVSGDFVIEESREHPGFIYLVGIESPGITASAPIAGYVSELVINALGFEPEKKENTAGRGEVFGCEKTSDESSYPGTHKMICRCERVTEREILRAFDDIVRIGAQPTVKGIKNRTGAFRGSCQGCFCTIDMTELLRKHRGLEISELTYDGEGSELFEGRLK